MTLTANYSTIYYTHGDYIIEVRLDHATNDIEAWLTHKEYGASDLIIGYDFTQITLGDFEKVVENWLDDAITNYENEHIAEYEEREVWINGEY